MKAFIALIIISGTLLYSQGTSTNIGFSLPVTDSSVNRILDYNLRLSLQYQIESIQRQFDSKIIGEFHVGGTYIKDRSTFGMFAIKTSPFNSKIPSPTLLHANIFKVRQLFKICGDSITEENNQLLNNIEKQLGKYEKSKYRRPSFGIIFPFTLYHYDTSYSTYNYTNTSGTSSSTTSQASRNINKRFDFSFDKVGGFIGYDIGDFCTLSLGAIDVDNPTIFAGISIDVSTPTYYALTSFRKNVGNLTKSYIPITDNPIY